MSVYLHSFSNADDVLDRLLNGYWPGQSIVSLKPELRILLASHFEDGKGEDIFALVRMPDGALAYTHYSYTSSWYDTPDTILTRVTAQRLQLMLDDGLGLIEGKDVFSTELQSVLADLSS